jgi:hypothetical protein
LNLGENHEGVDSVPAQWEEDGALKKSGCKIVRW